MARSEGVIAHRVDPALAARYRASGWWTDRTVSRLVETLADERPEDPAFVTPEGRLGWASYLRAATSVATALVDAGLEPGERCATFLPDGATIHAAVVANELAGLVTVGIGARAGEREIRHLLGRTGATTLITLAAHRGEDTAALYHRLLDDGLPLRHHLVVPRFEEVTDWSLRLDGEPVELGHGVAPSFEDRRLGADDLFLINSTSGTTGLPKCVMHAQNSKFYMADRAREVAELTGEDVVLGLAPMPFGFGLFSTHFIPVSLGAPAVVTDRFSAEGALELIERERATVLVCVSTQFKMMLTSPDLARRDLSSLRAMFTGGEAIPYRAAREFEERTGAKVLNFYGSNESGVVTGTRLSDPTERRLRTGGSGLVGTELRLYDDGVDVTATRRGQPGSRGPALCLGYYDDPAANAELFTPEGFVLHADIVTLDEEGYLSVVGRKSELIIRGGKNISAAEVEEEVAGHPSVALVAAVPMPDPVFGERVCAYVELRPGTALTLDELVDWLGAQGVSKEHFPEHLVVLDRLPRSSGGKVAKGELAADAGRRAGAAEGEGTTVGQFDRRRP